MSDERLKRLIARRNQAATEMNRLFESRKAIVDLAGEEAREDLSDEEDAEFRSISEKIKAYQEDIAKLDERVKELADEEERNSKITEGAAAVRRAQARVTSVGEAATYVKGNGRSYFSDLMRLHMNLDDNGESRARLERHAIDVRTGEEYRAGLDRIDSSGGYFVPPIHLVSQYVPLARAGRATADLCAKMPLPGGTDSINIPKISTGPTVAVQATDNGAVSETDPADTTVAVPIKTLAGQVTIAQQLLDQSPVNFDEVIFKELLSAHAQAVDLQVISGANSGGAVKGILTASNTISMSYTTTAPTAKALYPVLIDGIQRVQSQRYEPATVVVMHPRRFYWLLAAQDSDGRPLITASGPGVNQLATFSSTGLEQVVGNFAGLPVVTDPNIPTNLGTGTNEDVILIMKADDLLLLESPVRTRAFPEVLSSTLSVRLQLFSYVGFTAERNPKSIVKLGGTGLISPTF